MDNLIENENVKKLDAYQATISKLLAMESEICFWKSRQQHFENLQLVAENLAHIRKIINELITQIELGLHRCVLLRAECLYIIEEIPNPMIQQILFLRYVSGQSMEAIAQQLHYSVRHVSRLHNKGLEMLLNEK